jgi:outer membrane protein OmpA-like peptidoglycan-associated protein
MSRALQSVITPAIAQGIADNKEQMIDALYPIMGGMISKYVTQAIKEMMEKINEKIEQGFSFERYKRKLKAKLTGVSEGELLLEESTDAHIAAMFIIHKETGLLISEAHLENSQIGDPHMVASMASAIKDFVNDWIANQDEQSIKEVQILSYADATLYIESAGSVYIIAFLDSEPDHEQRTDINAFFASLLKHYATFFQNFDGDDSRKEVAELSKKMYAYLETQKGTAEESDHDTTKPKSNPARLILSLIGVALLVYAANILYEHYNISELQTSVQKKTGENVYITKADNGYRFTGVLDNPDSLPLIEKMGRRSGYRIDTELSLSPAGVKKTQMRSVKPLLETQKMFTQTFGKRFETLLQQQTSQVQAQLKSMEKSISTLKQDLSKTQKELLVVENALKNDRKRLSEIEKTATVERLAKERLHKVFQEHKGFHAEDGSLDLNTARLFEVGKSLPREEILQPIRKDLETYIGTLMEDPEIGPFIQGFVIESYTDSSGNEAINQKLSQERANRIMEDLLSLPLAEKYGLNTMLHAKGMGSLNPVISNGAEDKEASRRIKIRFVPDKEKILGSLIEKL